MKFYRVEIQFTKGTSNLHWHFDPTPDSNAQAVMDEAKTKKWLSDEDEGGLQEAFVRDVQVVELNSLAELGELLKLETIPL